MRVNLFTAAIAAVLIAVPALADDCQLKREASLDMKFDSTGRINIPAEINNHPVEMALDTGANFSMLSHSTAAKLGLREELFTSSMARLWGGIRLDHYVNIDQLQFGRIIMGKTQMFIVPDYVMPAGVDGIIAADAMSRFDADFDFASGKFNLFNRNHCAGKVVYWTDESQVAVLPFKSAPGYNPHQTESWNHIIFYVTLDGKDLLGLLDTGAVTSTLDLDVAKSRFDLTPQSPGMEPVKRTNGTSYRYPFKSLSFGGVSIANPTISIDPYEVHHMPGTMPPLLIGMTVIHQLHLYVAYEERKIYVSSATAH